MSKERMGESIREHGGVGSRPPGCVTSYERHFEGYAESRDEGRDGGRGRRSFTYVGQYYRASLSRRRRIARKSAYAAACLSCALIFLATAKQPIPSNRAWYVAAPQAASVFCLAWALVALASYVLSGEKLTIPAYKRSSRALIKATLSSAVSLSASAAAELAYLAAHPSHEPIAVLACAAGFLACALMMYLVLRSERGLEYEILPNPASFGGAAGAEPEGRNTDAQTIVE